MFLLGTMVVAQWLALLLHSEKVLGSNLAGTFL